MPSCDVDFVENRLVSLIIYYKAMQMAFIYNDLGRGGYGTVYHGIWKHTEVAIKRIRPHKDGSEAV